MQSLSLPAGHPDSTQFDSLPVSEIETAVAERTATVTEQYGIDVTELSVETTTAETATDETDGSVTVDSPIAYTKRMPPTVAYDADRHALECTECGAVQDPTRNGMLNAIRCHSALADVDSANIPICEVSLTLSEAEHDRAMYTHRQLLFLQTVYNAQSLQYDAPYYDIVHDSMLRLREYLGIEQQAVDELIDDGLLKRDGQKPHLLYTVTGDGRTMLNEAHREGVDYGHGIGDLEETSEHRMMVETLVRYLRAEYVADDESSVTEVCRYYEPGTESSPTVSAASAMGEYGDPQADADQTDRRRFDVVGLDAAGEIVIAGEAERCNNDVQEAAVADFDKMAAYDPEESIWVVPSRSDAADIVAALNDLPAGPERVGTTYSANTAPKQYSIDTAGLSSMVTINTLRDRLPE